MPRIIGIAQNAPRRRNFTAETRRRGENGLFDLMFLFFLGFSPVFSSLLTVCVSASLRFKRYKKTGAVNRISVRLPNASAKNAPAINGLRLKTAYQIAPSSPNIANPSASCQAPAIVRLVHVNVPKRIAIVSRIRRVSVNSYRRDISSRNQQLIPARIAAIQAAGMSLIHPAVFKIANGSIEMTAPSGNTEYQPPSNGTNSFTQVGGCSVSEIWPSRKAPATRNV